MATFHSTFTSSRPRCRGRREVVLKLIHSSPGLEPLELPPPRRVWIVIICARPRRRGLQIYSYGFSHSPLRIVSNCFRVSKSLSQISFLGNFAEKQGPKGDRDKAYARRLNKSACCTSSKKKSARCIENGILTWGYLSFARVGPRGRAKMRERMRRHGTTTVMNANHSQHSFAFIFLPPGQQALFL